MPALFVVCNLGLRIADEVRARDVGRGERRAYEDVKARNYFGRKSWGNFHDGHYTDYYCMG